LSAKIPALKRKECAYFSPVPRNIAYLIGLSYVGVVYGKPALRISGTRDLSPRPLKHLYLYVIQELTSFAIMQLCFFVPAILRSLYIVKHHCINN